jgi:hypothetical protein
VRTLFCGRRRGRVLLDDHVQVADSWCVVVGVSLAVLASTQSPAEQQMGEAGHDPLQNFCTGQSMSNRNKIKVRKRRSGLDRGGRGRRGRHGGGPAPA